MNNSIGAVAAHLQLKPVAIPFSDDDELFYVPGENIPVAQAIAENEVRLANHKLMAKGRTVIVEKQPNSALAELVAGVQKQIVAKTKRGKNAKNLFLVWDKEDRKWVKDLLKSLQAIWQHQLIVSAIPVLSAVSTVRSAHIAGYKPTWFEFVDGLLEKFEKKEDISSVQCANLNKLLNMLSQADPTFNAIKPIIFV
ncbi:hypothetical protein A6U96_13960 [Agrobacterium tumefaciens]|nr:hypothetical protein A6U96_13960 [Agrobacterium tumefaciens]